MDVRMWGTRVLGAALLCGAAVACDDPAGPGAGEVETAVSLQVAHTGGLLVLSQQSEPGASMAALFEGRVVADTAGCLRLDYDAAPTVVWPRGVRARTVAGEVWITDAAGTSVARVGDEFSLGGGEVEELFAELGFDPADQALAEARCPGRFWVMGGNPVQPR